MFMLLDFSECQRNPLPYYIYTGICPGPSRVCFRDGHRKRWQSSIGYIYINLLYLCPLDLLVLSSLDAPLVGWLGEFFAITSILARKACVAGIALKLRICAAWSSCSPSISSRHASTVSGSTSYPKMPTFWPVESVTCSRWRRKWASSWGKWSVGSKRTEI